MMAMSNIDVNRETVPPGSEPLSELELFQIAPIPLIFTRMDGTIVDANEAACELLGVARSELIDSHAWEEQEYDYDSVDHQRALIAWQSRQPMRNLIQGVRRRDGQYRRIQTGFEPVTYRGIEGMLLASIDITERVATESALLRSEEALRLRNLAFTATSSGMVVFDAQATGTPIVSVNPAYTRMLGVSETDLVGKPLKAFASEFLVSGSRSTLMSLLDPGHERSGTLIFKQRGGAIITTEARFSPVRDASGMRSHHVGILQDVTDRVAIEAELRLRSLLLDEAPAAILAITNDGVITHWNAQAEMLLGWPRSDAIDARLSELAGTGSFHLLARTMLDRAMIGERWEGEAQLVDADGRVIDIQATSTPIPSLGSRGSGMVAVIVDITERKAAEIERQRLAVTDQLTGLPNRTRFIERLQLALSTLEPDQVVSVFFINVDQVRDLNASLGHMHGDHALIGVANRLQEVVGGDGMVARFAGDTFSVIVPINTTDAAEDLANRFQQLLNAPLEILGRDRFLEARIGYTLAGPHQSVSAILSEADTAQRAARGLRPSQPVTFRTEMAAQAQRRLELETDLRRAVLAGQFELHYQPIVSLSARTIVACEALIRWRRPGGELVLPGEFIPLAEDTGLVIPIGQWVLEEVCRTIQAWDEVLGDRRAPDIHVNISPDQFRQPDFASTVMETLASYAIDPKRIALELTETMAMIDSETSLSQSRALRRVGVRLALDDFGAGYSNLGLLNKLPVQMLKIDRTFAHEIETAPGINVITRSLIQIGRDLGMVVTGEGIESAEQADRLAGLGANRGQGYFFAEPMPDSNMLTLLKHGPSLRLPH